MAKPTTTLKQLTKTISTVSVAYILNPSTTAPLLCLHGFGASSFSFLPLFKHLPNRTLLAYDAPAFGHTTRPTSKHFYSPEFSATIASNLANHYTNDNYQVLAHSMGALAAARLENVSHLILIAPALLPRTFSKPLGRVVSLITASFTSISAFLLTILTPVLAPILSLAVNRDGFWRAALTLSRHPSHPPSQAVISGYRAPLGNPGWERGLLAFWVASLKDRARGLREDEDFVDVLRRRHCRIMIIHGEDDAIVPLDNSVRLAERLNARLVVLKECGHVPHEECPDVVASHITQFLKHD